MQYPQIIKDYEKQMHFIDALILWLSHRKAKNYVYNKCKKNISFEEMTKIRKSYDAANDWWKKFEWAKIICDTIDNTWMLAKEVCKFDDKKSTFTDKTWEVVSRSTRIQTLDDLIIECDIDLSKREISKHVINKREVWAVIDWVVITEPLFQVKAWLDKKTKLNKDDIEKMTFDNLKDIKPYDIVSNNTSNENKMIEICIFDAHINKLVNSFILSNESWNHDIATSIYRRCINKAITAWKNAWCSEALLVVWNDFFQTDWLLWTTTKWTNVDYSTLWQHSFLVWQRIIIEAILTLLSSFKQVKILMVAWNHDKANTFYLGQVLEAYFRNTPWLNIDNNTHPRKYAVYGKNMIMFTHGDSEKRAKLPWIMAIEQPWMWWQAKFREIHMGHYHTQQVFEENWIILRYLNSICPADSWHVEKWYVGNVRWASAFVWDKEQWLEAQFTFNL